MLAMLWERYPDHPNLLPAYWDESSLAEGMVRSHELTKHNWVSKPRFGREGTAISYWKSPENFNADSSTEKDYNADKTSLQRWAEKAERDITKREIESSSIDSNGAIFPLGLPVFQQW